MLAHAIATVARTCMSRTFRRQAAQRSAAQRSAAQRSAAQEIGRAASLPHSTEALEAKVDDEFRRWYGLLLLLGGTKGTLGFWY
jgi:hypothetical protein